MKSKFKLAILAVVTLISALGIGLSMAKNPTKMSHGEHKMELGAADEFLDLRFIDGMIPHHQGAIVMAEEALLKSRRPEIKKLAQAIIKAQQTEIKQLQVWRKQWYPQISATPMAWHGEMGHMMAMTPTQIQAMMMSVDLGAADTEFDLRFIKAMVPHHEGALIMAKEALQKSRRPEIQKMAQEILDSQEEEITQMQKWQQAWY